MSGSMPIYRPFRAGDYLIAESGGTASREAAIIVGDNLGVGTILGRRTSDNRTTALDPAATDGTEVAAGILYAPAAAAAMPVRGAITARNAEVNGQVLGWPAGISADQQTAAIAQLAALGILVRS